ncbi:MAG: NAD(P)/FAD-dependent oxidoreductase [Erysipelotrichaceae bacterium]|uniref:NAD(P)/FAD-dependent oxidoreductase n=1 Tax=Floccifex sp. TaxID=2815810 RepID=UPI002A7628EF|nr:NAD(P)/FAD-dependent oxidoreductase [Floccifex sp.]MDD7281000.1 NAD(P)/FAD-dependent oxidoreductase [Erysipelotrichaceae bacterium]MDY2957648.1 NAD(P)/FAD-dependent oxidoreductase [Floccifex sp.]
MKGDVFLKYTSLMEPIKIGQTVVKNRVFMPPVSTNLCAKNHYISDELIEHYASRARGGVGLIITEVTTVEPVYTYLPGDISICDDSYIEGWKKLADACHEYGAKIMPQLFHPAYMAFPLPGTPQLIAPSNVGPYYAKSAPRAVTIDEIHTLVKQFGDAAYRAKVAGCDGVEVHAAHAHGLLGGFLTPLYNKRTDEYGGDINGRLRIVLEVIEEIRKRCGNDFIIDVRISGDEYSDGGLNINDMIYVCKQLEKAGVDFIHCSGGNTVKRGSSMPAPGTKQGSHCLLSEELKKYIHIPVATVGRINEPWIANELIENGKADICMMGRANLCDSDFVTKAMEGREDEIRPCIGCGRCLTGVMFGKPVGCTVNPSVETNVIPKAEVPKKVLVIGGGPAGLEAAYVCSQRGHEVVLCEKTNELGGLLRLAAVPVAKQDLSKVIKFMITRLKKTNVEIRMNCEVTNEMIENEFKDYVVLGSTGAKSKVFDAFTSFKSTMTADDILAGRKVTGKNVVIIGGGSVGCETADYLAPLVNDLFPANRNVTILEMTDSLMTGEGGAAKSVLTRRLMEKGVRIEFKAKVERVDENNIYYTQNGTEHVIDNADTLVFALGYTPTPIENDRIIQMGDSAKVGNLKDAIGSAYEIAMKI